MRHTTSLRIRFSDTDMLGHVNNASYFTYMEEARCRFIEDLEFTDIPLILAAAKVNFRNQSFYGDTLDVETWVTRIGNSSAEIGNSMRSRKTGEIVFEGTAVIVYFDYGTQRPAPMPDDVRARLEPYLQIESV